jgi:glycosyltransferase involved in cell wall biosynthesis
MALVSILDPVDAVLRERRPTSIAPVTPAGKLFTRNGEPFYLKGVTYGTFAPDGNGDQFPAQKRVLADFRAMAANGFNVVRTYTVPPPRVLDAAAECRLQILAGLTWEQHVTFLDEEARAADIRRRVRDQVRACAGHDSLFGFTIGNEIPASIVRWHGHKKVEQFLYELFDITKDAAPSALATYVNFPTTAYLDLPFLDFAGFNVYLEEQEKLAGYLRRLQNIAGDIPLVLAEIGLDSRRNGQIAQAHSLDWQIRTAYREGCAGAFVYAWTDEWYRGGQPIEDWDFGLTTRMREPKPALHTVRQVMADVPFKNSRQWPKFSVVVCTYNGSRTIRDTLDNLAKLDYPNYEVIVVNDGSTDSVPEILKEYNFQVISTPNQGLSQARNEGLAAARGEFIVYIDDDAYPPPPWLKYLALAFLRSDHACIGGPNYVPAEDGWVGQCVADSPGGPLHVLVTDELAEHVPGCNMAFRRSRLAAIGGFDPLYRTAGDDVDVCWRLQDQGWTIGFTAPAMVWHHRRATVTRYWRQQVGYGKAEALLERKWPERFTALGHMTWAGQIYGRGLPRAALIERPRIYQGTWGLAPYQGLYTPPPNHLLGIALTPEWLLLAGAMFGLGLLGLLAAPFIWAFLPFIAMAAISVTQALRGATEARYLLRARNLSSRDRLRAFALIFFMHLMQPAARLWGRLKHGLTPWRRRPKRLPPSAPASTTTIWSELWRTPQDWLTDVKEELNKAGAIAVSGGDFDEWDLRVRGGLLAGARMVMAAEDHEGGKQNVRFRTSFTASRLLPVLGSVVAVGMLSAVLAGSWIVAGLFAALGAGLAWQTLSDWRAASGETAAALAALQARSPFFYGHGSLREANVETDQPEAVVAAE